MFDGLFAFGHSIVSFMTLESIFFALASCLVGVIIGALPGLTATMGVALMTTLTIKLPSAQALLILICTYVGAIYGGSRSAILLNIPGTPASSASCLDGYALARQGQDHAGRQDAVAIDEVAVIGGPVLRIYDSPIPSLVALQPGMQQLPWHQLEGGGGGNDLAKWEERIHRLFYRPVMNQHLMNC